MTKRRETTSMMRGCIAILVAAAAVSTCSRKSSSSPTGATSGEQTQIPDHPAPATQLAAPETSAGPGPGMMGGHGMMGAAGNMMGTTGITMMQGPDCPMTVAGTRVQATSTANGMDMMFTTSGDAGDLRRRVRAMAEHMNPSPMGGAGMPGMMGGAMHGLSMMGMPPVQAQVDDVDGGARMHVMPIDRSRLDEVRQHMQQGAQMMTQQQACPMAPTPSATTSQRSP